jgi:histidinol-phosphate aminotransferase
MSAHNTATLNGIKINANIINGVQYTIPYTPKYLYKLDVIENFFGQCPQLESVLKVTKPHVYPYHDDNYHNLITAISAYTDAPVGSIIVTNGSDSALKLLIDAYVTLTSRVLIPTPTYPHFVSFVNSMYKSEMKTCQIEQLEELLDASHYDLVYISSPNIPIGYCFDLARLTDLLNKHRATMFILDEAYFEFGTLESGIDLINHGHKNICVTRTFSKTFGLAGLRIGYLVTHADNVATLRVLHNDKSVTDLAVRAALTVLENIDYYNNVVARVNDIKTWLGLQLDKIISPNCLITGYCILYGNFFIIKSSDPQLTCAIFAQQGIMIRNKDSELPGCIRITIWTEKMMRDVIGVCKMLNLKHLLRTQQVGFDLDGTLRKNAKNTSWYDLSAINSIVMSPYVITNNNIPVDHLKHSLNVAGLDVDTNAIITPAYGFKKYKSEANTKAFFVDSVDLNIDNIVNYSKLLSEGYTLTYSDSSKWCSFDGCSETDATSDTIMPDLATLMSVFQPLGNVVLVGKPSKWMIPDAQIDIYVGDSDSDYAFSRQLGATFVRVGGCETPNYDSACESINIPDVSWLV